MKPDQAQSAIRQLAAELRRLNAPPAKTDWWSRASVISTFLSSVVIALVGLAITSSIQKAQLLSSEQSAKAQLEAVRLKDESDERIQQSKLEADLFEHLFSNDALHRALALNMLHRAVPSDFYEQTVLMFAAKDPDPGVSSAAIKQLSVSTDPNVLRIVLQIANDPARPPSVRAEATLASKSLAFSTSLSQGTIVMYMYFTRPGERAFSTPAGSLFTRALLDALRASASTNGGVNLQQLSDELASRVTMLRKESGFEQFPSLQVTGLHPLDQPLFGPGSSVAAVVVGSSPYSDREPGRLAFPVTDATKTAEYLKQRGAQVILVTGNEATRANVLTALSHLKGITRADSDVIFYFGGHSWSEDGKAYFVMSDAKFGDISGPKETALSTDAVMRALSDVEGRRKILFLDMSTSNIDEVVR